MIQENVLDTNLEGLDLAGGAGDGARSGARFVSSVIPGKGPGQPREVVDVGTAALARAQEIEGSESPGSLALLAAAIDLNADPDLADLLDSMLIDRDDLAGFARKRRSEDASAEEVVQSAAERYGDSLDPAGLIAAAAQRDSPRLRSALSIPRLPPRELAAQVAEWRRRRADKGATTTLHLVVSVLHLLGSIATSILLVLSVLGSGEWWWLALLYPVWSGYPKEGPWFGAAVGVVLGVLVGPVVAAAQAVTVLLEIAQATIERDLLWAGTGIRISIRQQRHVVSRLLNARGRRVQKSRQLARLMIAARFSR